MKIEFCGGARTVTGSQHLLEVNGHRVLLECGLFQGRREEAFERNHNFCFDPSTIDAMVLSHAHIDHSGNIPSFVRRGFEGPVYTTHASADLCKIMLKDSAFLQERDLHFANKIRARQKQPPVEPLYGMRDVDKAITQFRGQDYDSPFAVCDGVTATLRDAGHMLGSAGVLLQIQEGDRSIRLGFSGDIGRTEVPILRDPNVIRDVDALIIESTYGDRLHSPREDSEDELAGIINGVAKHGGKVIIPAFAVGRTQVLVYMLHRLFNQGRIPDIPIYVDSPLAVAATQVFRDHPECFDEETFREFVNDDADPFGFGRLEYVKDVQDSKRLNALTFPHIIISASGMAEGGRILHHLRNNIGDSKSVILFVGYAAQNTLARRIMDGNREVKIFGEPFQVKAKVHTMDAFSGHADRDELLDYVSYTSPDQLKKIFLVHGEVEQSSPFREALLAKGYEDVRIPSQGDVVEL